MDGSDVSTVADHVVEALRSQVNRTRPCRPCFNQLMLLAGTTTATTNKVDISCLRFVIMCHIISVSCSQPDRWCRT